MSAEGDFRSPRRRFDPARGPHMHTFVEMGQAARRLDLAYCTEPGQLVARAELYDRTAAAYEPGGRFAGHIYAADCAAEHRWLATQLRDAAAGLLE